MNKIKILVTGSNGQLGRALKLVAELYPGLEFIFLSKEDFPIQHSKIVQHIFSANKPQFCINCAAYTAVDKAEIETEEAFLINATATGILAAACDKFNTKFIHISTDYVFNGNASLPYTENDQVDPINTYGASKLKGELLSVACNEQTIIIRTSWVYSQFGNNFVKTMIRLLNEKEILGVVNDQSGSPTYATDLAQLIIDIINSSKWEAGIYHYSNDGIITWFEFASAIKESIKSTCVINPITTADFPTLAKRPLFSGLNKKKIKSHYNCSIPEWKTSLKLCLEKIANQ